MSYQLDIGDVSGVRLAVEDHHRYGGDMLCDIYTICVIYSICFRSLNK
jgi:hypothetical protein